MAFKKLYLIPLIFILGILLIVPVGAFSQPTVGGYISQGTFPKDTLVQQIPIDQTTVSLDVDPTQTYNIVIPAWTTGSTSKVKVTGTFGFSLTANYNKSTLYETSAVTENVPGTQITKTFSPTGSIGVSDVVLTVSDIVPIAPDGIPGDYRNSTYPNAVDLTMIPTNTIRTIGVYGYVYGDMEDDVMTGITFLRNSNGLAIYASTETLGDVYLMQYGLWVADNVGFYIDWYDPNTPYFSMLYQFLEKNMTKAVSEQFRLTIELPRQSYPEWNVFSTYTSNSQLLRDQAEDGFNFMSWLINAGNSVLEIEIFPGFQIASIFAICVAIPLLLMFLKFFAGG